MYTPKQPCCTRSSFFTNYGDYISVLTLTDRSFLSCPFFCPVLFLKRSSLSCFHNGSFLSRSFYHRYQSKRLTRLISRLLLPASVFVPYRPDIVLCPLLVLLVLLAGRRGYSTGVRLSPRCFSALLVGQETALLYIFIILKKLEKSKYDLILSFFSCKVPPIYTSTFVFFWCWYLV